MNNTGYTGANLKARALIMLAEMPLRAMEDERHIYMKEHMGEFHIALHGDGISYMAVGVLPLSDLPEIMAALEANKVLQMHQLAYRAGHGKHQARDNALRKEMGEAMDAALAASREKQPAMTREVQEISDRAVSGVVSAKFRPQFEALQAERRAEAAKAMPAYFASGDVRDYLKSIDQRAVAISGITREAEEALLKPTPQWHAEWTEFIEKMVPSAGQRQMLLMMRGQSSVGELLEPRSPALFRIGKPEQYFDREMLEKCLVFANTMAVKRSPFMAQATSPAQEDIDDVDEAEAMRP